MFELVIFDGCCHFSEYTFVSFNTFLSKLADVSVKYYMANLYAYIILVKNLLANLFGTKLLEKIVLEINQMFKILKGIKNKFHKYLLYKILY